MTSIAFIAGVFPLVISRGAGAEMRQAMGIAVFSGMIGVTLFGLFLTPVFYTVLMKLGRRKTAGLHHLIERFWFGFSACRDRSDKPRASLHRWFAPGWTVHSRA